MLDQITNPSSHQIMKAEAVIIAAKITGPSGPPAAVHASKWPVNAAAIAIAGKAPGMTRNGSMAGANDTLRKNSAAVTIPVDANLNPIASIV